jgi:phospholipid/cholesterol/gamma-HCH transport system permease protein
MRFREGAASVLERRGREVGGLLESAGFTISLLGEALLRLPHVAKRRRAILDEMARASLRVLHVLGLVGGFSGMILSLQTGLELARFGQQESIGTIVAVATAREMGPFITAVVLAATVGSAIAAELGTMAVSEEILALEVMSIDTVSYLVLPRVVALALLAPILTVLVNAIGILGGALVAKAQLDVPFVLYAQTAEEALRESATFLPVPKDLYVGLLKAFVFGIAIAAVGCASGIRAAGGAGSVGDAVRRSVRNSIILIIVLGYFITWSFYR